MTSYVDFSKLGETGQNFTYEILGRIDTLGPTIVGAAMQVIMFLAVIGVVVAGVLFVKGLLNPKTILRPLTKM